MKERFCNAAKTVLVGLFTACAGTIPATAEVPALLHYQGHVAVGDTPFTGAGYFKFALVGPGGAATYWSNDGTSTGGSEPAASVSLAVSDGLFAVQLGDAGMTPVPYAAFQNSNVLLRTWFSTNGAAFERLDPDQRIAAVGYAMMAQRVVDGAITAAKIADGAITSSKLALNAVNNGVLPDHLELGDSAKNGWLKIWPQPPAMAFSLSPTVYLHGESGAMTASGEVTSGSAFSATIGDPLGQFSNPVTVARMHAAQSGGIVTLKRADGVKTVGLQADEGDGQAALEMFTASGSNTVNTVRITSAAGSGTEGGRALLKNSLGQTTIDLDAQEGATAGGQILLYNGNGVTTVQIDGDDPSRGGWIGLYRQGGGGNAKIELDATATGGARITTEVLEITGGADLSENFDINPVQDELKPGMIVCIDPEQPGQLITSTTAYDKTVAGIVSGAGGVNPGLLMGHTGTKASGKHPVALSGRVYCLVDADPGAIRPGDLITTSHTPGHGMKVQDHGLAQGAIIGKAMSPLAKGKGLVLVLVSLQ